MNYIITDDERSSRKYRIWEHLGVSRPVDPCPDQAVRFKTVLQLGLQVKCHRRFDEVIIPAVVRYTMEDTLTLEFRKSYLLGLTKTVKLVSRIRFYFFSFYLVHQKLIFLYFLFEYLKILIFFYCICVSMLILTMFTEFSAH